MEIKVWAVVTLVAVTTLTAAQHPTKKLQQLKNFGVTVETVKSQPAPAIPLPPFVPKYFDAGAPLMAYQANEPVKVYEWLAKYIADTPGKPDQFSTSDEKHAYESVLADRLKSVKQIPVIAKCQKKYNGDLQSYEIKASVHSVKNYYSLKELDARAQNVKVLSLSTENIKRDSYTGQNAYGAETQISRTTADVYAVAFPLSKAPASVIVDGSTRLTNIPLPYDIDFKYLQFNFGMVSTEARANDKNIACLFIFSVAPPYILKFSERSAPTRDLPFEDNRNYHSIYGSLDQIAVINMSTGDIYEQAAR